MPQKKRTTRKRSASPRRRLSHGFGMLVVGMISGSLATILWQGMRIGDSGTGSGIRTVVEQTLKQSEEEDQATAGTGIDQTDQPVQQPTSFDFFTVLPEIEMVVPGPEPTPTPSEAGDAPPDSSTDSQTMPKAGAYRLQAGSYQNKADADRLKAELALRGYASRIQKVTIQGRGDFYRVRLGPWSDYDEMVEADKSLASFGIKALRLRISGGGSG